MAKTFPIQVVKTRGKQDIFKKEAGGSNELPDWVNDDAVRVNSSIIISQLNDLEGELKRKMKEKTPVPILMTATLHEKATAKSYRSSTRAIFDTEQKRNIIGMDSVRNLIVKIANLADVQAIKQNVQGTPGRSISKDKRCGIASVVDFKRYVPTCDANELVGKVAKVRLANFLDIDINRNAEEHFIAECNKGEIEATVCSYSDEAKIFRVVVDSQDTMKRLATMDGVISIKPMPYFEITASPEPYNTHLPVQSPKEDEEYAEVGLLDSGVDDIPHLRPWMRGDNQNVAGLDEHDIDKGHGTAVAGILLYGDELQGEHYTGCKPMWLTSCVVNTDPSKAIIEEVEMVEYIRTAIADNPNVKVWNLSQGTNTEVSDDCFSDFAIFLDSVQKEYGVLICKSAGNQLHPDTGELRITHGADSIRSLVVGSISHDKKDPRDGEINERSPFSRIGFGPEFLVKPDVVHYGGNLITGVQSFSFTGYQCGLWVGTSFSTPRVAALAANLGKVLSGDFNPLLVKALIIHSSEYPGSVNASSDALLKEQGYGLPAPMDDILNNDADEFTMVFQPVITRGEDYQILDFPFPSTMVDDDGYFYGDITVTVVTDPILKPSEGSEYCQTDVDVKIETHQGCRYYVLGAAGTPKTYRNAYRLGMPTVNVLAKDNYSKKALHSDNLRERTLIATSGKYQPTKKYHVSLGDMTKSKKEKALKSDRSWCMKLTTLYRDATEAEYSLDGVLDEVHAVVIVTIRDPKKRGVVYDECMQLLEQRNFEHSSIIVENKIDVRQ